MKQEAANLHGWSGQADLHAVGDGRWITAFIADAEPEPMQTVELVAYPWRYTGRMKLSAVTPGPDAASLSLSLTMTGPLQRNLLPWQALIAGFLPHLWGRVIGWLIARRGP